MYVTVYTDASHFQFQKTGAWAFYAKSGRGKIERSGMCKGLVEDILKAEVHCIINAIYCIKAEWTNVTGILVCSDSKPAINPLTERTLKPKVIMRMAPEIVCYDSMIKGLNVTFKWVPSHQEPNTIQAWVNNRVDQLCKKAQIDNLRAQRRKRKK
jgi:ribonuclease HI